MAISMKEAVEISILIAKAKYPILLRGSHGIGKSMLAYQLAEKFQLEVIEKRLSQMSEGDFLGIPFKHEDGYTKTSPMYWLWKASTTPVVLFLDEIDRADRQLRQAAFQLMDSRMVDGVPLHPDTIIIGAINGGIHGRHYMVQPMDPAELSRYSVIDLEPTQKEWLEWAKENNISKSIISFISSNPAALEHSGDFEQDSVYPCRRSWERFNKVLTINNIDLCDISNQSIIYNIGKCYVGVKTSTAFGSFLKTRNFDINIDDLLCGNLKKHFKGMTHSQINEVFFKLENGEQLKTKLNEIELKNLVDFYFICPDEFLRKMISVVSNEFSSSSMDDNLKRLMELRIIPPGSITELKFSEWWSNRLQG